MSEELTNCWRCAERSGRSAVKKDGHLLSGFRHKIRIHVG
jgi:hypothetical protein